MPVSSWSTVTGRLPNFDRESNSRKSSGDRWINTHSTIKSIKGLSGLPLLKLPVYLQTKVVQSRKLARDIFTGNLTLHLLSEPNFYSSYECPLLADVEH
jgi:hypothetical protein